MKYKRRLWIVSELYYPEETATAYILTEVSKKLAESYTVHVICGPKVYDKNKSGVNKNVNTSIEGVTIKRLNSCSFNKNHILGRIINFMDLSIRMIILLFRSVTKEDKVLIVTNPAFLLIFMPLLKWSKGFEFSILVHDIFPDNTIASGILKSVNTLIYKTLKLFVYNAYSQADKLIVLGRDMKEVIIQRLANYPRLPQIHIIENWGDTDSIKPQNSSEGSHIRIQYAGNLGRCQGLMELLDIISQVDNSFLIFSIFGTGTMQKKMQKKIVDLSLNQITLNGSYTRTNENELLNSCDIAVVTLADGMYGLGVPSKSYNIMAAGKPILFIGDLYSEIALMVKEHQLGYCFAPSDKIGLVAFLQNLRIEDLQTFKSKGTRARVICEKYYTKDIILEKIVQTI